MRRLVFSFVLFALPATESAAQSLVGSVSFRHDGCESRCAVYGLTIKSDGHAVYDGRFYVRRAGVVAARVRPQEVRSIFEKIAALNLNQLKPVYRPDAGDCEQWLEDRPTSTLTIDIAGTSRAVTYNLGCVGPVTSRLAEIEREMNRVVKTDRWIK